MNKLKEIIAYRSVSQRNDFLEYLLERGIDEEEREEVIDIILTCFPVHNDWTLVLLIDLSNDEELISEQLKCLYLSGLLEAKTYYVKLSILDYFARTIDLYRQANITIDFSFIEKLAYSKKDKLIVRNQALLGLMKYLPARKEVFLSQLNQNLRRTNDYRIFVRLYSTLLNNDFYKEFSKKDIFNYVEQVEILDLGRAAKIKSEELKLKLLE